MTKGYRSPNAGKGQRISTNSIGKYGTFRSNSPELKSRMKRFNGAANRPSPTRKPSLPKTPWDDEK